MVVLPLASLAARVSASFAFAPAAPAAPRGAQHPGILVARTLHEYSALALALVRRARARARVRAALLGARASSAVFDVARWTARFERGLAAALDARPADAAAGLPAHLIVSDVR